MCSFCLHDCRKPASTAATGSRSGYDKELAISRCIAHELDGAFSVCELIGTFARRRTGPAQGSQKGRRQRIDHVAVVWHHLRQDPRVKRRECHCGRLPPINRGRSIGIKKALNLDPGHVALNLKHNIRRIAQARIPLDAAKDRRRERGQRHSNFLMCFEQRALIETSERVLVIQAAAGSGLWMAAACKAPLASMLCNQRAPSQKHDKPVARRNNALDAEGLRHALSWNARSLRPTMAVRASLCPVISQAEAEHKVLPIKDGLCKPEFGGIVEALSPRSRSSESPLPFLLNDSLDGSVDSGAMLFLQKASAQLHAHPAGEQLAHGAVFHNEQQTQRRARGL